MRGRVFFFYLLVCLTHCFSVNRWTETHSVQQRPLESTLICSGDFFHLQEGLPRLPPEPGCNTLMRELHSQCPEERSSLSLRTKVENKVKTLALGLPQLTTLTVLSIQYHIPPWMSTLYENQYKHTQVCVCTSPFPYEAPVSHKTYRKYIYMLFSHLSVFLSFRSCQRP